MSYELAIEKKDVFLQVTASGTRSVETVLAICRDVLSACAKEQVTKALLDIRGMKGHLETLEAFMIPDQYFPKLRDLKTVTRCSVIDLKEAEERYTFFENVAVNRGFLIRFFTDPGKAAKWLKC